MRISDWSSDVCSSDLGDGPHDEALAAAHVTGHEHAGNARLEVGVAGDVGASVELHAKAFEQALGLRSEEAHGQEHELALDLLRSEERRVGKAWVRTFNSGGSQ